MTRPIILDAAEPIACPKCAHAFPLSEGISRQTIERYAEDFERSFAERRKALETELAAEAKRRAERAAREQYETEVKAMKEALAAKEGALAGLRNGELELRRQLREAEDKRQGQELEYQRKLDAERKTIEERARTAAGEEFGRREAQYKAQLESAQREAADPLHRVRAPSGQVCGTPPIPAQGRGGDRGARLYRDAEGLARAVRARGGSVGETVEDTGRQG